MAEFNAEIDARNAAIDTRQEAAEQARRKSVQTQESNNQSSCRDDKGDLFIYIAFLKNRCFVEYFFEEMISRAYD